MIGHGSFITLVTTNKKERIYRESEIHYRMIKEGLPVEPSETLRRRLDAKKSSIRTILGENTQVDDVKTICPLCKASIKHCTGEGLKGIR